MNIPPEPVGSLVKSHQSSSMASTIWADSIAKVTSAW